MALTKALSSSFRQHCEGIATDLRNQLGLRAFDRLPTKTLTQHLNARLFTPQELPSLTPEHVAMLLADTSWSAGVVCKNPLWIVYHPEHSPARHEADVMHECAHVLLQHPLVSFNPETMLPQRRQQDEDEATYLGGCLQIPRRGLLWAVQRKMTIVEIREHFGASEAMVLLRSNVTGVSI